MELTITEAEMLVNALDSYIRRMIRDYNHKARQGAEIDRLQAKQVRIEAAKELRDKINGEFER